MLKLYGAHPVAGLAHIHGKKSEALVHVGAVDLPTTTEDIDAAVEECARLKQRELHVLGWDWESERCDVMAGIARQKGITLRMLQIPQEAMESQAVAKGDLRFLPLASLEAEIEHLGKLTTRVALKGFAIPNTESIPQDARSTAKKWTDYIDYWAVDWDFQNDTFAQGWAAYRTRKEKKLPVVSDSHAYEKAASYCILVRVIDIFGNDTRQAFAVEVR